MKRKPTTTAVFVFFSSSITAAALGEYPALVSEQNKQTHTLCTCFCVHAKQGEALSWDDRRNVNSQMRHLKRNLTSLQRKEKKKQRKKWGNGSWRSQCDGCSECSAFSFCRPVSDGHAVAYSYRRTARLVILIPSDTNTFEDTQARMLWVAVGSSSRPGKRRL